jgi:hypothetical protein
MRMFMKILRMPVSVFSLILASAVPGSAQTNVFVIGNTSFTVTWQGVETRSHAPGHGHVHRQQLVGHVIRDDGHQRQEHDCRRAPTSTHGSTAFGFGLTPEGTFSNLVERQHLHMGIREFPGVSTRRCVFDVR